jgi:hypothetical protein
MSPANPTLKSARTCAKSGNFWPFNAIQGELWSGTGPFAPCCNSSLFFALEYEAGCAVRAYFGLRRRTRPRRYSPKAQRVSRKRKPRRGTWVTAHDRGSDLGGRG